MSIDRMTPEERSRRASELLDDPFIQHVLDMMELKYVDIWRTSAYDDYDTRGQAYERLQALYEFRADLEMIATESAIRAFNRRSREVI
jgi:hypothetical protein